MNASDLVGRRVARVLKKVIGRTVTLRKQEGEVLRVSRGSNGKKVWVLFDENKNETSVEVGKLSIID